MDEIKIVLLNKDLTFNKNIFVDVQEYDNTIEINDYKLNVNKRLFIDYIVKDMSLENYLNINNEIFKIVKIKTYSDYQEIFIHEIENIKVNGIDKVGIIVDTTEKIIDYKNVITDFSIATGDLVYYQNQNWLIVGEVYQTKNSYKATLRKAPHVLKIYINNKLEEIPCIIETGIQNTETNQYISLPNGNIKVMMQDNDITKKIAYGNRFIKMNVPWNVAGFTSENKGLKYLYCEENSISPYDDMGAEIADRWNHDEKHEYSIIIDNTDVSINKGSTQQLSIVVKDSATKDRKTTTITIENPTLIFSSSDESICSVSSTGLITAINIGKSVIIISYKNVVKNINVTVANVEQLIITGKDNVGLNRTATYTSTIPCTWSVEDVNNDGKIVSSWVTSTSQTETTCTVEVTDKWIFNDSSAKYFNIIAVSKANPSLKVINKVKISPN